MILVIGYGSLMSRLGFDENSSTKNVEVINPFIVRFKGTRNFNTSTGHYMDIGKNFNPVGDKVSINENDVSKNSFECLAYYIREEDLQNIALREGYPLDLMHEVNTKLSKYNKDTNQNLNIAEFLWTFYPDQERDLSYHDRIQRYRKNLGYCIEIDILNVNRYIPHPVKVKYLQENRHIFGLISIHTDIGAKKDFDENIRLMTINQAINSRNPPRKTYFLECILGGVHGVNVRDLLSGMDLNDQKIFCYIKNLKVKIYEEWDSTQDWKFHGDDLHKNLKRSGILGYFSDISS